MKALLRGFFDVSVCLVRLEILIAVNFRGKAKAKGASQISLQKAIGDLTKKIKQTIQDVADCDAGDYILDFL